MKIFKTTKQIYYGGLSHWVLTIMVSALSMAAAVTLFKDHSPTIMFAVSILNILVAAIGRQLPNSDQESEEKKGGGEE